MPTLYRNWTVTVQDSKSPYTPISNLQLYLYEGKVELKVNPATGSKDVFIYGTSTLATRAVDRYGVDATALVADVTNRPGEYDFIELDLNNRTKTPASAAGSTLYSVVAVPAGAINFNDGRVIIDSTSLDDPNVKQTLANLGGGLTSVIDNLFFAGGTVSTVLYDRLTNSDTVIYLKLTNLPDSIANMTEDLSIAPPFYDSGSPSTSTVLIPRFNAYYTNEHERVIVWKAVRAYKMSDDSFVIRLRADQYNVYRTHELVSSQIDLQGIANQLVVAVDVEDQNTHYRSFNKNPQYALNTSGPEGVLLSVYQSDGIENVGIGQWGFSNPTTDMPIIGVDIKHSRGMRATSNSGLYPYQLFVSPDLAGKVAINTGVPQAKFHIEATDDEGDLIAILNAGKNCTTSDSGSVAIGDTARALAANAFALGYHTTAQQTNSYAIGYQSQALHVNSMAVGYQATASGILSMAIGPFATAAAQASIAIGNLMAVDAAATNGVGINLAGAVRTLFLPNMLGIEGGKVYINDDISSSIAVGTIPGTYTLTLSKSSGPILAMYNHSNIINADDILGGLSFVGKDNGVNYTSASIRVKAATAWAIAGQSPAYMVFATAAASDPGPVERVRVTEAGVLHIGFTGSLTGALLTLQSSTVIGTLDTKYTSPGGSGYVGMSFVGSFQIMYIGSQQGLNVTNPRNLYILPSGQVLIGKTNFSGDDTLYVESPSSVSGSPTATFRGNFATTYIRLNSDNGVADVSGYVSLFDDSAGSSKTVSVGPYAGVNANNLNVYKANSGSVQVSIGTTSHANALDVSGSLALGGYAGTVSPPSSGSLITDSYIGVGTPTPIARIHTLASGGSPSAVFENSGSVASIWLKSTGVFGIMTLDTSGATLFTKIGFNTSSSEGVVCSNSNRTGIGLLPTAGKLHVAAGIVGQPSIYAEGSAYISGAITSDSAARIKPSLTIWGNATDDSWVYYNTSAGAPIAAAGWRASAPGPYYSVYINGADQLTVNSSGRVGIGIAASTTPGRILSLNSPTTNNMIQFFSASTLIGQLIASTSGFEIDAGGASLFISATKTILTSSGLCIANDEPVSAGTYDINLDPSGDTRCAVILKATSAVSAINLPTAAFAVNNGRMLMISNNRNASVTVNAVAGQLIWYGSPSSGHASQTLLAGHFAIYISDGIGWYLVSLGSV